MTEAWQRPRNWEFWPQIVQDLQKMQPSCFKFIGNLAKVRKFLPGNGWQQGAVYFDQQTGDVHTVQGLKMVFHIFYTIFLLFYAKMEAKKNKKWLKQKSLFPNAGWQLNAGLAPLKTGILKSFDQISFSIYKNIE